MTSLADTKERALPAHDAQTLEDYLVYLKHRALYEFAQSFCKEKIILDLGCGEGYGSHALVPPARFVVAADYLFDVVAHARSKYAADNLAFVVCDAAHLPFRSAAFDAAISLEVIEHVSNVQVYLEEIKRVNCGIAILSTPNRSLRLLPFQKPWNQFHRREYAARDLRRALVRVFGQIELCGVIATPEVMRIEIARVKQNPFIAYARMIVRSLLPPAAYARVKTLRERIEIPTPFQPEKYSVSDFQITPETRRCINLIAVCQK